MKEENYKYQLQINNSNKVAYFLSTTDHNKPALPSNISIFQLVRQYLNDDDFIISVENKYVFENEHEEQLMQRLYNEWSQINQLSIDDFIIYWINKSPHFNVNYSLYDDINVNNQQITYKPTQISQQIQRKCLNKNKSQPQIIKGQISIRQFKKQKKQSQVQPLQLLNKFFIFYSRKQVNSNKKTFNEYEKQCNSLNLTKWMRYCRDVGITKYKKQINNKRLQQIFIKYEDSNKQLIFEQFKKAVEDVLKQITCDEQKVKIEGFQIIGILNQDNFKDKFRQMGEILPHYSIQVRNKKPKNNLNSIVSKTSLQPMQKRQNISMQLNQPNYQGKCSLILPKIKEIRVDTSSEQTKNSQRLQNSFLKQQHRESAFCFGFNKKIVRQRQQLLCSLVIDEDDDPYLKRYNDKQNIGKYRCVANRIDERVSKICYNR